MKTNVAAGELAALARRTSRGMRVDAATDRDEPPDGLAALQASS